VIKAVVDSNVLLSGLLTGSTPPGQIVDAWRAGRFQLVTSDAIVDETIRQLTTNRYFRRRLTTEQIARAVELLESRALRAPGGAPVHGIASHPEDDLVLSAALNAGAGYLVTGDLQMQKLGRYQGVTILSPRAFLDILGG
jgi:putative PIN family toxin of toxin-antitoxin system